jgi:hypothetical protein
VEVHIPGTKSRSKLARGFGNPHTSGNPPFHNRRKQADKANQARSKANDTGYIKNGSIPLSQKAAIINLLFY